MSGALEKIRAELDALLKDGMTLAEGFESRDAVKLKTGYQNWYTRALSVVRVLLPERVEEFEGLYREPKRKDITWRTYSIEDFLLGLKVTRGIHTVDGKSAAGNRFINQYMILASSDSRLDSIVANIRGLLQAELFDSELDAARHLLKNGFLRAAGAVAGVVLEHHLKELADKHEVKLGRKKATMANLNNALREADVYDVADWRWVQHLGDIRNLCDHKKEREPRPEEVKELIDGTEKAIKTLA